MRFSEWSTELRVELRVKFSSVPIHKTSGMSGELAGTRTQDPRLKRALLYQLSYELSPKPLFPNYHSAELGFRNET